MYRELPMNDSLSRVLALLAIWVVVLLPLLLLQPRF
jgi:hypothetical protein